MERLNVRISARLLQEFKNAAKSAYGKEEYAILMGLDELSGLTVQEFFFPGNRARFCSENHIKIQKSWFKEAQIYAYANNMTLLGDIHSHPSGELGPSECDIDNQTNTSFQIFGICGLFETKTGLRARIRFWPSLRTIKIKVT